VSAWTALLPSLEAFASGASGHEFVHEGRVHWWTGSRTGHWVSSAIEDVDQLDNVPRLELTGVWTRDLFRHYATSLLGDHDDC
jgi:hypothetical protein